LSYAADPQTPADWPGRASNGQEVTGLAAAECQRGGNVEITMFGLLPRSSAAVSAMLH
jgi:hypothetical protein